MTDEVSASLAARSILVSRSSIKLSRIKQRGVSSIEYALIGALIAVAIIGGVNALGLSVTDLYAKVSGDVTRAVAGE